MTHHKLLKFKFVPKDSQKYYETYARLELEFKNEVQEAVHAAISSTKDTLDSMTYLTKE